MKNNSMLEIVKIDLSTLVKLKSPMTIPVKDEDMDKKLILEKRGRYTS